MISLFKYTYNNMTILLYIIINFVYSVWYYELFSFDQTKLLGPVIPAPGQVHVLGFLRPICLPSSVGCPDCIHKLRTGKFWFPGIWHLHYSLSLSSISAAQAGLPLLFWWSVESSARQLVSRVWMHGCVFFTVVGEGVTDFWTTCPFQRLEESIFFALESGVI